MNVLSKILHLLKSKTLTNGSSMSTIVPNNIVLITSDPKVLYKSVEIMKSNGFTDNSSIIRLDNGDYSIVMRMN